MSALVLTRNWTVRAGIPGSSRAFGRAALPPLAAEPGLHRNDEGQETRGSGRPEEGAGNRRSQRSCRGKIFMLIRQTCQKPT